jgi:hypothetical protein
VTNEPERDAMGGTPEAPPATEEERGPRVAAAPVPAGLAASSAEHRAYVQRQQATLGEDGWPSEGEVLATYHGPSGAFVAGEVTFEAGAGPVAVDVAVLRGLREHFPDHTWQVADRADESDQGERKGKNARRER